jgi:hypothetical protein
MMGLEYEIECYNTHAFTAESLRVMLGVQELSNPEFTVELQPDARIYFCHHVLKDSSRIAFAKIVERALSSNDAVVIRER